MESGRRVRILDTGVRAGIRLEGHGASRGSAAA